MSDRTIVRKGGYGGVIPGISLFLFLITLLLPSTARSGSDVPLNTLIQRVEERRVYDDPYWHTLLHYQPRHFGGVESLIDDPAFFLSPQGKQDPRAELIATLQAFYQDPSLGDHHPRCRFPARYEWLRESLSLDAEWLSGIPCPDYRQTLRLIDPQSVALVFPASYMNNPASMFGHTLFRFDRTEGSRLVSYAANYAALVEHRLSSFYVLKGIFGYYKGYYKVFPYYERVKEYNDIEQRDMWEYDLNFTPDEARRMFDHLWELRDVYSFYYFFDENCSYNLLYLIEAGRGSLRVTDRFGAWVLPIDTIRVIEAEGIVTHVQFRPAQANRIRGMSDLLDTAARRTALKIADGEVSPSDMGAAVGTEGRDVLDLAAEFVQYRYHRKEMAKEDYQGRFLSILSARSHLGRSDDKPPDPSPPPPEAGHLSSRLGMGGGIRNGDSFAEVRYRPVYHSLTDPDDGYVEGLQIVFVDTALRVHPDGSFRVHGVDLIDIRSLAPRNLFFHPVSFKIQTGLSERVGRDGGDHRVYRLNPGFGVTYQNRTMGLLYALGETDLEGGALFRDQYALGAGVELGLVKTVTPQWKLTASVENLYFGMGETFTEQRASGAGTLGIDQRNSVSLALSWERTYNHDRTESTLLWNRYF